MVFNAITFKGVTFTLKSGECTHKEWGMKGITNTNSYRIRLSCSTSSTTYTTFDFWCSNAHPKLDEKYLASAFQCFIDDCVSGTMTFDDFVDEFGYDDPKQAYHTWMACKNAAEKIGRIWSNKEDDLYDLLEFLREQEDNDWPDFYHNKHKDDKEE